MTYRFATLNFKKLKTGSQIKGAYEHNHRLEDKDKPGLAHINRDLEHLNEDLIEMKDKGFMDGYRRRIEETGAKERSNSVKIVEAVVTYPLDPKKDETVENMDPELLKQWKKANVEWMQKIFGKENIISATYHGDESSPHIHFAIVPIFENKLSCSHYMDGREKLSALQSSYAEQMSEFGLSRGVKGSQATHQDLHKFRAAVAKVYEDNLPKPEKNEDVNEYYERANNVYQDRNAALKNYEIHNKQLEKMLEKTMVFAKAVEENRPGAQEAFVQFKKVVENYPSGEQKDVEKPDIDEIKANDELDIYDFD